MKKMHKVILLSLFISCIMVSGSFAQTTRNAGTYSELVTAISNSAASGDIINFTANIVITSTVSISKSLTIIGNGYTLTVPVPGLNEMGGYNASPSGFRVLITSGSNSITINNLTIKGGFVSGDYGGAIYINDNNTTLKLNNCVISNSRAFGGGALYNNGILYLNSVYILRNGADNGGGLRNTSSGKVYIESSTLVENRSTSSNGGGGAIENKGYMYINNSTVSNNQSTEIGSAINNYGGTLYFVNSSATGNVSYGNAITTGAIGNNAGFITIVNSLLAYNYHRTTGDVNNPTGYVLDDLKGYSNTEDHVNMYYSIYHASLPTPFGTNTSNIQYTGNASGSDNSLFAYGISAPINSTLGGQIGDPVFRPFLFNNNGSLAPMLKTGSFALEAANKGTRTRFANNNNVNPVVAYFNGSTYVNITGTSTAGQEVLVDQFGETRTNPPCRGAVEGTMSDVYIVRILYSANGEVNGGTYYGDVYTAGETATLTAMPNAGYSFVRYDYVLGGAGVASTSSPYSFAVNSNITLQPVFASTPAGSFNITYIGNENTGGVAPATTNHTASTTISGAGTLVKAGYAFSNWNTNAYGFGTTYAAGATYNPSPVANLILYAQYIQQPTCNWTGTASTDWNSTSNWSNSIVPTNAHHAYIPNVSNNPVIGVNVDATCKNLTLEGGTTLTIQSNASGDGSLIVNGVLDNSGLFKVERYLTGSKWHLVSSPITNALSEVFLNIYLKSYNEATNTFGSLITPTTTPMPVGQGFSVWTNAASETRTFSGTINYGSITPSVQLTGTASSATGWNLIGNPYPCSLDWDAASGWTKTGIANSVYVWSNNQYASYVGGVSTNGGSRYIAMGQGFFVQATSGSANISMDNNVRVHNSVGYMKTDAEEPSDIIRVKVNKGISSDETVIAIRENGSDLFSFETDAVKLPGSITSPQIHTVKTDDSQLAISALTQVENVVGKYVYIDFAETGTHQLLYTHTLTGTYIPRLFDTKKQMLVESNSPYSFEATVGEPSARFQFIESLPMSVNNPQNSSNLTVWESNNKLFVVCANDEIIKQISIYSVEGNLIYQGVQSSYDISHLSKAMYLVKVITNKQIVTKKIVRK
jgi:hypothetical protein